MVHCLYSESFLWLQVATAQLQVRKADLDADNAAHKIEQLLDELQVSCLTTLSQCFSVLVHLLTSPEHDIAIG